MSLHRHFMRWLSSSMVKRILRWLLFGGILFFLAKTLKDHWQEVRQLQITGSTWALLTIALGITLVAHIWSGWVWHWILYTIGQPRDGRWSAVVYLKTNIAKYLPGNVWHFYGRVRALQATGSSTGAAIVGVVLEPVLMAAAALGLAAISFSITVANDGWLLLPCMAALVAMLVAVHPRFLNPVLRKLGIAKAKAQGLTVITSTLRLQCYPWRSLLGELGFVALRGMGFMMTVVALQALEPSQFFPVLGAFSVAWLSGLVVPGAPGGVGVFEAVAIALLGSQIPSGLLISSVALYRLISTLAEALGAGLIWLEERITDFVTPVGKKKRPILLPPPKDEISQVDHESDGLLDTVAPENSSVSYTITPKQELLSKKSEGIEDSAASDDIDSTGTTDAEMVSRENLNPGAPVLPSFIGQSSIREGEPTTQSFSPHKKR